MKGFIRKQYHWLIAFVVLIELAVYVGMLNNLTGLYIIPVTQELQISRGGFSLAFSIRSLTSFLSILMSGAITARYKFRPLSSIAIAVAGLSFGILAISRNTLALGIGAALMGMCEGFCTTATASRIVSYWFYRHQGTVLGLVSASTGIGGSILCIFLSRIIESYGWRSSYLVAGAMVLLTAVLFYFVVYERPQHIGLRPYGKGHMPKRKERKVQEHWLGYSMQELTKKATFYLMIAVTFLSCVCNYVPFYVITPHLQDNGFSASTAASLQSIMLLSMAGAKFLCGALSDWIGAKKVTVLCMLFCIVSLLMLSCITGYLWALVAVITLSIALPLTTITIPLLSASLFGYQSHNAAVGIFLSMVSAAAMVSSPLVNTLYDILGSYDPIFFITAIVCVGVTVLFLVLFRMADRDRKAHESKTSQEVCS